MVENRYLEAVTNIIIVQHIYADSVLSVQKPLFARLNLAKR